MKMKKGYAACKMRLKRQMLRRVVCGVLCAALLFSAAVPVFAQETSAQKKVAMSYTAKSALLMEQDTGKVLFAQNETQALAPASLTKLMDLILIYEAIDAGTLSLEQKLTCSPYAKTMGGSEIWLKEGEQMTVEELLKALIVASANDAAVVFAEAIATTEQAFVERMNQKAQEMGLVNTHFVNCTGFDEEGHYTCAQDVAAMARKLMTQYGEQITRFSIIWMDSLRSGETELVNTNRLIRFYDGATGLKTGTTDAAGHCLCATATRNGMSLISVIMGCKTSDDRFEESKQLLDYGFSSFTVCQPQLPEGALEPAAVARGEQTQVLPKLEQMPQAVVRREEAEQVEILLEMFPDLQAPIEQGEQIGRAVLRLNGEEIAEQPVTAAESVGELTFSKSFGFLFRGLVGMESGKTTKSSTENGLSQKSQG